MVVPTVKLPKIFVVALRIFAIPVVAPTLRVVAAPAKFTVVAVVFNKSKEGKSVAKLLVIVVVPPLLVIVSTNISFQDCVSLPKS